MIIRIYTIFSATSAANTYECIHTLTGVAAADTASYSCSAVIGSHTEPSSNSAALSVLSKCKKYVLNTEMIFQKIKYYNVSKFSQFF